jgi:hypothetical protein
VSDLSGWTPVRISSDPDGCQVEWRDYGKARLQDPFFQDTVQRYPDAPRKHTPLENLLAIEPCWEPTALVFHQSRCGSTLVSQMLAALPEHVVISEAAPIDSLLKCLAAQGLEMQRQGLRSVVQALTAPRTGQETRCFLKLDPWHLLYFPLFRLAFPNAHCLFVYRHPLEVMVSQSRRRGMFLLPSAVSPNIFGMDLLSAVQMEFEQYCSQVLATLYQAGIAAHQQGCHLVEYGQLPNYVLNDLPLLWNEPWSSDQRAILERVCGRDAKNPTKVFESDRQSKLAQASAAQQAWSETLLEPLYHQLEALREKAQIGFDEQRI